MRSVLPSRGSKKAFSLSLCASVSPVSVRSRSSRTYSSACELPPPLSLSAGKGPHPSLMRWGFIFWRYPANGRRAGAGRKARPAAAYRMKHGLDSLAELGQTGRPRLPWPITSVGVEVENPYGPRPMTPWTNETTAETPWTNETTAMAPMYVGLRASNQCI